MKRPRKRGTSGIEPEAAPAKAPARPAPAVDAPTVRSASGEDAAEFAALIARLCEIGADAKTEGLAVVIVAKAGRPLSEQDRALVTKHKDRLRAAIGSVEMGAQRKRAAFATASEGGPANEEVVHNGKRITLPGRWTRLAG